MPVQDQNYFVHVKQLSSILKMKDIQNILAKIIVPITNAEVELTTHHSAKQEFGSGAVMVCSYGDQNDVALFRELQLEEIVAIGLDGRMTEIAGEYAGLKPKQARTKIIEDLETGGFVRKNGRYCS